MKKQKTIYHLLVDKSGSMSDCIENTIMGFNEQVAKIISLQEKFPEQEISMGLTTFNNEVCHHQFAGNSCEVEKLNTKNYLPSGGTALLDAIGQTVIGLKKQMEDFSEGMDASVVLVILTDGYENCSVEFNLGTIRKMISSLEATGQWTFSFIGATLDAADVAEKMAIKRENSYSFSKNEMKEEVWDKLSSSMQGYLNHKRNGTDNNNLFEK